MIFKIFQIKIIKNCVKIWKKTVYLRKLQKKTYKQKKMRFQKILEEVYFHRKINTIEINIMILNIMMCHLAQNMFKVE